MKSEQMDVRKIITQWLEEHGYDGLFGDYGDCGCEIDDLMPCYYPDVHCEPGYKQSHKTCDCGENNEWHVGKTKGR